MSPNICRNCTRTFSGQAPRFEPDETGKRHYLHEDFASFQESYHTKCRICHGLWTAFEHDTRLPPTSLASSGLKIVFVVVPIPASDGTIVLLWQFDFYVMDMAANEILFQNDFMPKFDQTTFRRYQLGAQWYRYVFFSSYSLQRHDGVPDDRTPDMIGTSSKLEPSRRITNEWVRECVQSHDACKPWRELHTDRTPPARLLNVGRARDPKIRLESIYSTEELPFQSDYVTLSYRCGEPKLPTLTSETWSSLTKGINPGTLPKVFRNAIALTRQIGAQYLWIDSLCILQDSIDDWRTEAAKVGNIYQYSLLNIAATAADRSEDGLFFDRDPEMMKPLQVTLSWPLYTTDMSRDPLGYLPAILHDCIPQNFWSDNVDRKPLNNRAWVFQERMMSPRILHCGEEQLFWECRTKRACESFPENIIPVVENIGSLGNRAVKLLKRWGKESCYLFYARGRVEFELPLDTSLIGDTYRAWAGLVEAYSGLEITKDSEYLVAFSGIAKHFDRFLGDTYVAGIFLRKLHEHLTWYTTDTSPIRLGAWHSKEFWRAPSWSWASIKGKVKWDPEYLPRSRFRDDPPCKTATYVEYVDHIVEHIGENNTGELSRAWLKLKANIFLLMGDITCDQSAEFLKQHGPRAKQLSFQLTDHKTYPAVCQFDEDAVLELLRENGGSDHAIVSVPVFETLTELDSGHGHITPEWKMVGLMCQFASDGEHRTELTLNRIGRFLLSVKGEEFVEVRAYFTDLMSSEKYIEYVLI